MNTPNTSLKPLTPEPLFCCSIEGDEPAVLTDIYQDNANIVIWRRTFVEGLLKAAEHVMSYEYKADSASIPLYCSARY